MFHIQHHGLELAGLDFRILSNFCFTFLGFPIFMASRYTNLKTYVKYGKIDLAWGIPMFWNIYVDGFWRHFKTYSTSCLVFKTHTVFYSTTTMTWRFMVPAHWKIILFFTVSSPFHQRPWMWRQSCWYLCWSCCRPTSCGVTSPAGSCRHAQNSAGQYLATCLLSIQKTPEIRWQNGGNSAVIYSGMIFFQH